MLTLGFYKQVKTHISLIDKKKQTAKEFA